MIQDLDPKDWRRHRFGLPESRWRDLGDKSYWITGAGTGYGRCIALALAAAGAQVFLTGRRIQKLEEARREAADLGIDPARCLALPADITNPSDVERAARSIGAHTRHLYGLVNNAALPQPRPSQRPLAELEPAQWSALLNTNVTAQWLVSKAALPLMLAGPALRMVFMTSEAGWASTPGFGPYNVTKAALNNLGGSLAAECAACFPDRDVQINVLVPGEARTEMNRGSTESPYSAVCMTLALLSHLAGGPNGCFFHRDGRHLAFACASPHPRSLLSGDLETLPYAADTDSAARPGARVLLSALLSRLGRRK